MNRNNDSAAPSRLFFDNAATSFPKPPSVTRAVARYMNEVGAPARGAYAEAGAGAAVVGRCREQIDRLVNGAGPRRVVFGLNATDALNLAIKGVLGRALRENKGRARVVTTVTEHNSVLRPLRRWSDCYPGLEVVPVGCDGQGMVDTNDFVRAVAECPTDLAIICHASNVTGAVQPVSWIGPAIRAASGGRTVFLVDASQSIGRLPIDARLACIDLLAFPGHKALLGPQGTGGLVLGEGMEERLETVREGGTGSRSEVDSQPGELPEKYEAGSHNVAGIAGLSAAIDWLVRQHDKGQRGVAAIRAREIRLTRLLVEGLSSIPGVRVLGPREPAHRVGVVSFTHPEVPPLTMAGRLESEHGVLSRAGLHCAPTMHRVLAGVSACAGTQSPGATRLSLGPFLGEQDVRRAVEAVAAVCGTEATPRMLEHAGQTR